MKKLSFLTVFEAIFYGFVSICFFRFFYYLLIDIGTKHNGSWGFGLLTTMYPVYLLVATHVYALFVLHHAKHPHSADGFKKTFFVNGIILASLGFLLTLVSVVKMIDGSAPIDNFYNISFLFKLDVPVWGILYAFFGLAAFLYAKKYLAEEEERKYEAKEGNFAQRFFLNAGKGTYVVISLFYTGDLLTLPLLFDHSFSHFGSMIPVFLVICLFPTSLVFYELVYRSEKLDYVAKKKWQLLASSILLLVVVVSAVWLLIANAMDPDFLTEAGSALFPLEHMLFGIPAVGPMIPLIVVGIAACVAIINFIKPEKKEEVAE